MIFGHFGGPGGHHKRHVEVDPVCQGTESASALASGFSLGELALAELSP